MSTKTQKQETPTKAQKSITINGTTYPTELRMGAFVSYNRLYGEEFDAQNSTSVVNLLKLAYCILEQNARIHKLPWTIKDYEELGDHLTMADIQMINGLG